MGGNRWVRRTALALTLGLAATLGGCGDDDEDQAQIKTVRMTYGGYLPERLRIDTGDRVTFVNRTDDPQRIVDESAAVSSINPEWTTQPPAPADGRATDRGFSTRTLAPGERQTVTFEAPRVYRYTEATGSPRYGTVTVVADDDPAEDASAELRVTRDFGRQVLSTHERLPLRGRETLLRQLRAEHEVDVGFRGMSVNAIDGLRSDQDTERDEKTWAINVNGIETDVPPIDYGVHGGDVVQWDLRDWYVTLDVRATVGAFPQTFTRGVFGRRFPVRVICERPASSACLRVKRTLHASGVRTDGRRDAGSQPPPPGNPQRARILVGAWPAFRDGRWPRRIDEGPSMSGVFARFSPDARSLRLLDWNAHHVRTAGRGTGLVAAMRPTEEDLMWVVTGVDQAGVERAANALRPDALRDAFAVAVTAEGVEKLPLPPAGE